MLGVIILGSVFFSSLEFCSFIDVQMEAFVSVCLRIVSLRFLNKAHIVVVVVYAPTLHH